MKLARIPVYGRCVEPADVWRHVRDDVVDRAAFLSAFARAAANVENEGRPDWMVDLLFAKGGTCHMVTTTASAFRELFEFEPPVRHHVE